MLSFFNEAKMKAVYTLASVEKDFPGPWKAIREIKSAPDRSEQRRGILVEDPTRL